MHEEIVIFNRTFKIVFEKIDKNKILVDCPELNDCKFYARNLAVGYEWIRGQIRFRVNYAIKQKFILSKPKNETDRQKYLHEYKEFYFREIIKIKNNKEEYDEIISIYNNRKTY